MNSRQFVSALLNGYPEVLRPSDKSFLQSIQDNIQAINPSGETLRAVYKRLLDTCDRFPTWSMVKQAYDSISQEQRSNGSCMVSSAEFARWKLEACSLDDALPYMVECLVDSGEMSRELLAVVTGKHEALGFRVPPNIHLVPDSPRAVGWSHAGVLATATVRPMAERERERAGAATEGEPANSSIAGLDITSGGIPLDSPFPINGPSSVPVMGPSCEELVTAAGNSVFRPKGPSDLDRCGSCGKYFLRSGSCSCKDIADYDDSDPWEGL
jgi:hypothetical protein